MKLSHALSAVLACAAMIMAQAAAPAPAPAKAPAPAAPAAAPAKTAPVKGAKAQAVKGTLVSVDVAASCVVVKTAKGVMDTLVVDSATKIHVGGKKAALADLTAEMAVTTKFAVKDGKKVATEVMEKKAAAAKAKPAASVAPAAAPAAPAAPAPAAPAVAPAAPAPAPAVPAPAPAAPAPAAPKKK